MASRFLIPKKLKYAWGFVVTISVVPRRKILDREHGIYDPVKNTIVIADDLSVPEKRWVYLHEKAHADVDYQLWAAQRCAIAAPEAIPVDSPDAEEEED